MRMRTAFILMAMTAMMSPEGDAYVLTPHTTAIGPSRLTLKASPTDYYSRKPYIDAGVNRNAPKFRSTKSKAYGSMDEKRRQVERILLACRNHATAQFTITEANFAITNAGRLGRFDDAYEIFRSLEHLDLRADLMSYNNIIWCAGNIGKFELAKQLFAELQNVAKLRPNVYTYGSLLHGCVKIKGYKQALGYLDRMVDEGIVPNQIVFTSAMEACAEAGKYKEAMSVMDRILTTGMKPDLTMVNAAIKACSLAGAMEEAESLAVSLRDNGTMDLFTYHTLMMGHTKLGRHQRVLTLYDEALESGANLDGGVYSLAMLAALNCGMYQQVPRIAERARDEGVQLTEASYTILIQAYAEAGGGEQAVRCLDVMKSEGLKPNVISYAAAIAASKKRPLVVISLLEKMKVDRVEPNTVVLTAAIDSLAREGGNYTDQAFAMLQDMEENGPEPNIYTYNTVTRAFAEAGRLEEAMAVLLMIKKRGLQPDRFTFTTLLIACGRTGSSDQVDHIMLVMRQAGVVPDEIAFGAAIDAHRRASNSIKALECLQDMHKSSLEPSAAHYNLVLRTLKAEGYVDRMFKMAMMISRKEGAKVNANTFELVMEALVEDGKWRESLVMLKEMERLGFRPSLQSYVSLVELLEKSRQYKAALALYRVMVREGYDFYENSVINGVFKRLVSVAALGANADLKAAVNEVSNEAEAAIAAAEQEIVRATGANIRPSTITITSAAAGAGASVTAAGSTVLEGRNVIPEYVAAAADAAVEESMNGLMAAAGGGRGGGSGRGSAQGGASSGGSSNRSLSS